MRFAAAVPIFIGAAHENVVCPSALFRYDRTPSALSTCAIRVGRRSSGGSTSLECDKLALQIIERCEPRGLLRNLDVMAGALWWFAFQLLEPPLALIAARRRDE